MFRSHAVDVDGFKYNNPGNEHDGEVCQIVARVRDLQVLDTFGPAFFVRFMNAEVGLATASILSPWFPL